MVGVRLKVRVRAMVRVEGEGMEQKGGTGPEAAH